MRPSKNEIRIRNTYFFTLSLLQKFFKKNVVAQFSA